VRIAFESAGQAHPSELRLRQGGSTLHAPRIEGEAEAPAPRKEHHEIPLPPEVLDRFVGRYQLAPAFILAITREEFRLYVQATGQPRIEIFPEGEKEFFLKEVDAQIGFATGEPDKATERVLHQNGAHHTARRME